MSVFVFCHPETVWREGGIWHASGPGAPVVLQTGWLVATDPVPAGDATQGHDGRLVLRKGYRTMVSGAIADELRAAGYGASLRAVIEPAPPVERVHNAPAVWATMGQAKAIAEMEGRHAADMAALEARIAMLEAQSRQDVLA